MADIFHRVSIRKYSDRDVEDSTIKELLRAAMAAPSAENQQPWEFYVVKDREKLEKISHASEFAWPAGKAPVSIVAAYRSDVPWPQFVPQDMSCAMENLWLAADEAGLGGVWLGVAPLEERMQVVEKALDMPEELHAFAIFAFGYPGKEKKQQDRYDESKIHFIN